jgi:hypothetical protein
MDVLAAPTSQPSAATGKEKLTNDNSNPQQGTGEIRPGSVGAPSPAPADSTTAMANTSQSQQKAPPHQSKPTDLHANSKGSYHRNSIKIPPTAYDARKLFVGGLPADGKLDDNFMLLVLRGRVAF